MPYRRLAADELGAFLGAIAHPRRIQIVEELRSGAKDVGSLASQLSVSQSNVSQHLAVLRMLRVVTERREGRRMVYQLGCSKLAAWLLDGMQFLPAMTQEAEEVKNALQHARAVWGVSEASPPSES
ncbi:MAG: metalloregulator ArsR/SmtB family transcription factor [Pirellulales bacterium]